MREQERTASILSRHLIRLRLRRLCLCVCVLCVFKSGPPPSYGSVRDDCGEVPGDEAPRDEVPAACRRLPDTGRKRCVLKFLQRAETRLLSCGVPQRKSYLSSRFGGVLLLWGGPRITVVISTDPRFKISAILGLSGRSCERGDVRL